jgi:sortase B
MRKILVKIIDNKIYFKNRRKLTENYQNMLNTNIISDNELLFSDEYIEKNEKIVADYLNSIIYQTNVNIVVIENNDLTILIMNLFKDNSQINTLVLKEEVSLMFETANYIISLPYIKYFYCYSLPGFLLDLLDQKNIITESSNEILLLSNFVKRNNLITLSNMYYKVTLNINLPLSKEDEDDFISFCNINKYLKKIHLYKCNLNDIEFIEENLKNSKIKGIQIIIHDDIADNEIINYLSKYNKKDSKKTKIKFKLNYSKKYINNNILPETNIKILKMCCLIIIFIIIGTFSYVFYDDYKVAKDVNVVQNEIKNIIITNEEVPENIIQAKEENTGTKKEIKNRDLASLLNTNADTVGWLTINNTNIDYSIVQTTDNDFYLHHNFYKNESNAGWVFMDYRNNSIDLDDNTILYGHNRYYNGTMFGTLNNVLNKSWYTNETNLTISFNTLYNTMKWRIFSIYKIPVTTDYLDN